MYMYVVYIWKWSSAHALGGVSGVAYLLPLMNSFNKTEAAVFSGYASWGLSLSSVYYLFKVDCETSYPNLY